MELSPLQQQKLQALTEFSDTLDTDQLKQQIVGLYRTMLVTDNYYKEQLKQRWLGQVPVPASTSTDLLSGVSRHDTSGSGCLLGDLPQIANEDDRDSWMSEST